nr:NAD-dependent protein deacylase [Aureibacillus halotolerans]
MANAKHCVVLTGAGMSTESGLPDFRSSHGRWSTNVNPTKLSSIDTFLNNRKAFEDFYQMRAKEVLQSSPHEGHYVLAKWETEGLIKGIITQNVDGFHYRAGSRSLAQLHGTLTKMYCYDCHCPYEIEDFLQEFPICDCGGPIRPNIVLFGEMLPDKAIRTAHDWSRKADVMIVLGTSLQVTPASTLPLIAKEREAKLIIVNEEPTPVDSSADLVIRDMRIKDCLLAVDRCLEEVVKA